MSKAGESFLALELEMELEQETTSKEARHATHPLHAIALSVSSSRELPMILFDRASPTDLVP